MGFAFDGVCRLMGTGVVAVALAGLVACDKPSPPDETVRAVKLMVVAEGYTQARHEYAAEVRARVESRLGFRVGGKLVRRTAEPGQRVQRGQLLAQLDASDYQLATDAAQAQVNAAATQRDLAAADLKRYQGLFEQGFISAAEMERRTTQLKAAQAALDQARAQRASQGNQTAYTQLLADADGVVTAVDAEVGQVVGAGAFVVRLAQDGPRDVVFAVPEDRVAAVRAGQRVQVRVWASDARMTGEVREVAASADPVTRTFTVKVALAGEAPPLGATVYVTLQDDGDGDGGQAGAIRLPTSAIFQQGQGAAVWVYDPASSTVQAQPVQVAGIDGNEVVLSSGLRAGMQVVAAGVHVLAAGQKVMVHASGKRFALDGKGFDATNNVSNGALNEVAASAPAGVVVPVSR